MGGMGEDKLRDAGQRRLDLCREVYAPWNGALNNLTGGTSEQYEAEEALKADHSKWLVSR